MKSLFKKCCLLLFAAFFVFLGSAGVQAAAPGVSAASAFVLDGDTGACYFEKNADTRRAPASLTKLMTAYVIFEDIDAGRISYDSVVTISAHGSAVAYTGGYSNVPLNKGEQYTVDTMLKLILLPSACGACASMGDYLCGSESAFVARMNQTAASLGMDAHFRNSYGAGVDISGHYVTARAMATLASAFVKNHPDILKYTSLKSISFKGRTYNNTNKFLGSDYYAGVDGMKTGTSNAAGSCLTVSAKQNGRRLIVVVLKSGDRYGDGRKLLDYGFSRLRESDAAAKNAVFTLSGARTDIRLGADFTVTSRVSSVGNGFAVSGGWTVNGKTVKTFSQQAFYEGMTLSESLSLDAYAGADVTIGFFVNLPDGTKKTTEKVFSFSSEPPCAFRDIDGHWAESAIASLKDSKVFSGYPDQTFRPENPVTRAEFITSLCRKMEAEGRVTVSESASGFEDTKDHWADPYIAAMRKEGIASGVGNNLFAPEQKITRQEIAVLLFRAYGYPESSKALTFSDAADLADWAVKAVTACAEQGLISGYPDRTFRPLNNSTRAEAAMLLSRCVLPEPEPDPEPEPEPSPEPEPEPEPTEE